MYSMISLPLDSIITMKLKMQELLMEPVDVKVVAPYNDELMIRFEAKKYFETTCKDFQLVFNNQVNISSAHVTYNITFNWYIPNKEVYEDVEPKSLCSCEELENWSKESSFYDRIFEPVKKIIGGK